MLRRLCHFGCFKVIRERLNVVHGPAEIRGCSQIHIQNNKYYRNEFRRRRQDVGLAGPWV